MQINMAISPPTETSCIEAAVRVMELEDHLAKSIDFTTDRDYSLICAMVVLAYLRVKLAIDEAKTAIYGYPLSEDSHSLFIKSKDHRSDASVYHEAACRIEMLNKLSLSEGNTTADEVAVAIFNVSRNFFVRVR